MLSLRYFLVFSLFLFLKFHLSNGFGYCVDELCSFKCCQDFYTCAVSADCQSTSKPYTWPYPEGSHCSGDGDCQTDCCNSSTCKSKSTCTVIRAAVGGCISLGFLIILCIVHYVIRKRRRGKEQRTYSMIQVNERVEETTTTSVVAQNAENFNPQIYCDDKLAMNLAGGPILGGGMPCKPLPGGNIIISNFRISTQ